MKTKAIKIIVVTLLLNGALFFVSYLHAYASDSTSVQTVELTYSSILKSSQVKINGERNYTYSIRHAKRIDIKPLKDSQNKLKSKAPEEVVMNIAPDFP
jgi:hypothetical protein